MADRKPMGIVVREGLFCTECLKYEICCLNKEITNPECNQIGEKRKEEEVNARS